MTVTIRYAIIEESAVTESRVVDVKGQCERKGRIANGHKEIGDRKMFAVSFVIMV